MGDPVRLRVTRTTEKGRIIVARARVDTDRDLTRLACEGALLRLPLLTLRGVAMLADHAVYQVLTPDGPGLTLETWQNDPPAWLPVPQR